MLYDSLLLHKGGGIIDDFQKAVQLNSEASLIIGLGGTGLDALSQLKGKMHRELLPDNPGEAVARYDGIQLLGIDSDDIQCANYHGNSRLTNEEYFSLYDPHLLHAFVDKEHLKEHPWLNWMEIDALCKITPPGLNSAIRQIGRYLLISKAEQLAHLIQKKIARALQHRQTNHLDVYILTGLSGGTGGGCFLDVCYLLRDISKQNGWNTKIFGLFFMPDVSCSKPQIRANSSMVRALNCNGFAALKELDYHLALKEKGDWFTQCYCPGGRVRTQDAPVDYPFLISCQKVDGSMVADGYRYAINVATDFILHNLTAVQQGLTIMGHLAPLAPGIHAIPKNHGANYSYMLLGCANAEIPRAEINTYLAVGFFKRFREIMVRPNNVITKAGVHNFAEKMHFHARDVFHAVTDGQPALKLPDIDPRVLAAAPVCKKGTLPAGWAVSGNAWLNLCVGKMTTNGGGLMQPLTSFDINETNNQSLIGRLFQELIKMSMDPEFGPYYAAALLKNDGYDLLNVLDGEIVTAKSQQESQRINIELLMKEMVDCNQELVSRITGRRKHYDQFWQSAYRWYRTNCRISQLVKTEEVLRTFKNQVQELYQNFFVPLCEMLDNLQETFEENKDFLEWTRHNPGNTNSWQIMSVDDMKPGLDEAVDRLSVRQIACDFMEHLLLNPEAWLKGDENEIAMMVRSYMLDVFRDQAGCSMEDILYGLFPQTGGNPQLLSQCVEQHILPKVYSDSEPLFWCDPAYTEFIPCDTLAVPGTSRSVCNGATGFEANNLTVNTRQVAAYDRIRSIRIHLGIPLFAYRGLMYLEEEYQRCLDTEHGIGIHLYACTGRGQDGSGEKDWITYLPSPVPASYRTDPKENEKNAIHLYQEGEKLGIIGVDKIDERPCIFVTPDFALEEYRLEDFLQNDRFDHSRYEAETHRLETLLSQWNSRNASSIFLRYEPYDDENLRRTILLDYFIKSPVIQETVREEIRKKTAVMDALHQLKSLKAERVEYEQDRKNFCDLLFYRQIMCEDAFEEANYKDISYIYHTYTDQYGDSVRNDLSIEQEYPLYQAFLKYRAMNHKEESRMALDAALQQIRQRPMKKSDILVPAILEQIWNDRAVNALEKTTMRTEPASERENILRFYTYLRRHILLFRGMSPTWPANMSIDQLMDQLLEREADVKPNEPVWIFFEGEILTLYPEKSHCYAWHSKENKWVSLNERMYVWRNQEWKPIRLDDNNNIIL